MECSIMGKIHISCFRCILQSVHLVVPLINRKDRGNIGQIQGRISVNQSAESFLVINSRRVIMYAISEGAGLLTA